MNLSIIIASHGHRRWQHLAQSRALPSAERQKAYEVLIAHDDSLSANRAGVRNELASHAKGDWLCFLDADDELEAGYADAMAEQESARMMLTPAVSYAYGARRKPASFWPECELSKGNWMVVGTVIEKSLFEEVGGWRHLEATGTTNEFDDWELWIRCSLAGAGVVRVPGAVYIAYAMNTSKHRSASARQRRAWHREVGMIHFPQIYESWS